MDRLFDRLLAFRCGLPVKPRCPRTSMLERLAEVKQTGDSAWEDVKTGTGKAWEELRPAIQSAIARFE